MQVSLDRLKNLLSRHSEPLEVTVLQPLRPVRFYMRPKMSNSVKLYSHFCKGCTAEPELLGVKGTTCLMGCEKIGCQKRLFRIGRPKHARSNAMEDLNKNGINTLVN